MTQVEQRTFLPPVVEQLGTSGIHLPRLLVDKTTLTERGYQSAGIGIILLTRSADGEPLLMLGKHNATDRTSEGLWSWFGETLKEDGVGKIESTDHAVTRCFQEELGIPDIGDLSLCADGERFVAEVDLTAHKVTTGNPILYRIAAHIFWMNDSCAMPSVSSEEIGGVELFPLRDVMAGIVDVPLREFTAPVILDLHNRGYLEYPGSQRLGQVAFPDSSDYFSHEHADLIV